MKLSIIIPFYNVQMYIERCVESIIYENRCSDYEMILVDDGSRDASYEKIKKYLNLSMVQCVRQENAGLGAARNFGMQFAIGDYIWFVDSDDYLRPGAVDDVISYLNGEPDMIIFDFDRVTETGVFLQEGVSFDNTKKKRYLDYEEKKNLLIYPPMAWNRIVKTNIYKEHSILFPEHKMRYEDLPTTNQLIYFSEKVYVLKENYYNYCIRDNSIMRDNNLDGNKDILLVFDKIYDFYNAHECTDEYSLYLKIMLTKHIVLDAIDRINRIDRNSSLQNELIEYVEKKICINCDFGKVEKIKIKEKIKIMLVKKRCFCLLYYFNRLIYIVKKIKHKRCGI